MSAADTGCHAQVADRHRPAGRRDDAARMADQPQAGGLAQPSHQLLLEQRQHLVRSVRRGQPVSQLSNGGPAPNLLYRHRPVTQLGRGHRQERRQPPRLEVHADGPGPEWVAELQRAGGRGDHAAVGVLGRLDVGAGADTERRPEVDDEQRRRRRRQRQPGVRRRTLQVVKVVDQPVQRRSRHSGHVLHAHSIADAPPASRAGMVQPRCRQHRAGADAGRAPGRGHLRGIHVLRERWRILGPPVSPCMGEALNHPLLRYRALLRGLFAAKVDLVQRGVEHVRRDVEFVGCVGAAPDARAEARRSGTRQ